MVSPEQQSNNPVTQLTEGVRQPTLFRPALAAMKSRLKLLTNTTATGATDSLRIAKIFDLNKQVKRIEDDDAVLIEASMKVEATKTTTRKEGGPRHSTSASRH